MHVLPSMHSASCTLKVGAGSAWFVMISDKKVSEIKADKALPAIFIASLNVNGQAVLGVFLRSKGQGAVAGGQASSVSVEVQPKHCAAIVLLQ